MSPETQLLLEKIERIPYWNLGFIVGRNEYGDVTGEMRPVHSIACERLRELNDMIGRRGPWVHLMAGDIDLRVIDDRPALPLDEKDAGWGEQDSLANIPTDGGDE